MNFEKPIYHERYCAFVDVLGFKEVVKDINRGLITPKRVIKLLKQIQTPYRRWHGDSAWQEDFRSISISDAMAFSTEPTPGGLRILLDLIELLTVELLAEDYLIRGAITLGPLYHSGDIIFGEALVRAYENEARLARYPRVVLESRISDAAERCGHGHAVRQASDGMMFVNFLNGVVAEVSAAKFNSRGNEFYVNKDVTYYRNIRDNLQAKLRSTRDNPNYFEKIQWISGQWNDAIASVKVDIPPITGPGL
ncbi:hypothetical protein CVM73_31285 [Bradyrhizobium forestalis]|uniref:Guanylate cyclase domain-containing protein n=1 Tax=Bradyrhizobium forestalis TaxID=1419263 RepID=A0A2M8R0J2_9BRAD|nr:hypothetical protein [Bradyrhizobium forestalis]PJG51344.1 hypothetical protein CVM73_31285 [Bradyrhizobium forestalis]